MKSCRGQFEAASAAASLRAAYYGGQVAAAATCQRALIWVDVARAGPSDPEKRISALDRMSRLCGSIKKRGFIAKIHAVRM